MDNQTTELKIIVADVVLVSDVILTLHWKHDSCRIISLSEIESYFHASMGYQEFSRPPTEGVLCH